jgi:hypothetical protein
MAKKECVTLLAIETKQILVPIQSISPYIPHRRDPEVFDKIAAAHAGKAVKGRTPQDPEKEYESCFYRNEKGLPCIPTSAFKKAVVTAMTSVGDRFNFSATKMKQVFFIEGDLVPIKTVAGPRMRKDVALVGRGLQKVPSIRYRPEFVDWEVELKVSFNADAITSEQLINFVNLAGFAVGVGDWRPERNGNFGRFKFKA